MEIKQNDWNKIMEYTRDQLLKQCTGGTGITSYILESSVIGIIQQLTLDGYTKYIDNKYAPEPETEEEYIDRATTAWLEKDMV